MTATRRRQYGSGSVSQRASDGRWIGQIDVGVTAKGARRRITVTAKTEVEAKRKLAAKTKTIAETGVPVAGLKPTVKTWAAVWLSVKVKTLRPKAMSDRASVVNRWIVPTIGHRKLADLTPADVRAVHKAISDEGRTTSTGRNAHAVLRTLLQDAIAEGHAVPARILFVKAPTMAVSDRDSMDHADALAFLAVTHGLTDKSRWVAALLQGMRQGECLGLTWDCVDLVGGTVDVSWQLQAIPYLHGCGEGSLTLSGSDVRKVPGKLNGGPVTCGRRFAGNCPSRRFRIPDGYQHRQLEGAYHLVRPKTASGQRIIPLVPWMHTALTEWQTVAPVSPHGLVWPQLDGNPRRPELDRADWYGLQDAAQIAKVDGVEGRRYVLHEARHSTATLLLGAGVSEETIKAILGHASIVSTKGYLHVSQELSRRALEAVADRLQLGA